MSQVQEVEELLTQDGEQTMVLDHGSGRYLPLNDRCEEFLALSRRTRRGIRNSKGPFWGARSGSPRLCRPGARRTPRRWPRSCTSWLPGTLMARPT